MKVVLPLVLAALVAGCTVHSPRTSTASFSCPTGIAYTNVDRTYGLCLPSGWQAFANVDTVELKVSTPFTDTSDPFSENVNLVRFRVDNLTLQGMAAEVVRDIPPGIHNLTIVQRTNTTLAGEPAVRLEYVGVVGSGNQTEHLHWEQVLAIHNGVGYEFTYTALNGAQGLFQATVDGMLASFRYLA